jgi:hypothetical protein
MNLFALCALVFADPQFIRSDFGSEALMNELNEL